MMYKNKMAVALKHKGKVLREFKDDVFVPFGAEYSIFIKNLNSVKALVTVTVGGVDVGDGAKFIVNANDTIDIERFIKNGNFEEGNRLKFIERTRNIEKHRGVGIEDGLVRVEFQFEQPYQTYTPLYQQYTLLKQQYTPYQPYKPYTYNVPAVYTTTTNYVARITSNVGGDTCTTSIASQEILNEVENDVGITVPGSISNQVFTVGNWFPVETETHVVVLRILGETKDNVKVKEAVTVQAKPKCETCGRNNKATAKFCIECGTSLKIV